MHIISNTGRTKEGFFLEKSYVDIRQDICAECGTDYLCPGSATLTREDGTFCTASLCERCLEMFREAYYLQDQEEECNELLKFVTKAKKAPGKIYQLEKR